MIPFGGSLMPLADILPKMVSFLTRRIRDEGRLSMLKPYAGKSIAVSVRLACCHGGDGLCSITLSLR